MNKKLSSRRYFSCWFFTKSIPVLASALFGADTLLAEDSWSMFRGAKMSYVSSEDLPLVWQTRGESGASESNKKG